MERRKGLSVIAGERAIKPFYYIRNGVLHARYNVDRAIELTQEDETEIKALLSLPERLCRNARFLLRQEPSEARQKSKAYFR